MSSYDYDDGEVDYADGRDNSRPYYTRCPNHTLYARCTQNLTWTDACHQTWKLEDMTAIHRQNLLIWLERRSDALHQYAYEHGKVAYADRFLTVKPWFQKLPLVKRLRELSFCSACGHAI